MSQDENYTSQTTRVYTQYDIDRPPPHPGNEWTRFVCISDTHSHKFNVPKGDVLLHSGDLSSWGYAPQIETTVKWLEGLPHPVKMYACQFVHFTNDTNACYIVSLQETMM